MDRKEGNRPASLHSYDYTNYETKDVYNIASDVYISLSSTSIEIWLNPTLLSRPGQSDSILALVSPEDCTAAMCLWDAYKLEILLYLIEM